MKRPILALTGLLVAQIALAVGMSVTSRGFAGEAKPVPLLTAAADGIDRIAITDGKGQSVTLAKSASGWTLPEDGNFPADPNRVKTLLKSLEAAQEGAPVAISEDAAARFRVARAAFQRRLVLGPKDAPVATVYLGNSQGTRQVYVRRNGQQGVRLIDFAIYEAPATASDWADNTALKLDPAKIAGLSWGDVTLTRQAAPPAPAAPAAAAQPAAAPAKPATPPAPVWDLAVAGQAAKPADATAVNALTQELGSLWLTGIAPAPAADAPAPALDLKVTLTGGKVLDYRLSPKAKDGSYTLAASSLPRPVTLDAGTGDALLKETADKAFAS